jgi:hypothetical protein
MLEGEPQSIPKILAAQVAGEDEERIPDGMTTVRYVATEGMDDNLIIIGVDEVKGTPNPIEGLDEVMGGLFTGGGEEPPIQRSDR